MSFPRTFVVTCLASLAVARNELDGQKSISVGAFGEVEPNVVRRVQVKSEAQRSELVSPFAWLLRTGNRFAFHRGLNCSDGKGGKEIESLAEALTHTSLVECQKSCSHDNQCTCITYAPLSGMCTKHQYCHPENCVSSPLFDTYVMHSAFKVPRAESAPTSSASLGAATVSTERSSFERSGGRDCSNTAHVVDSGVSDLSVFQCLNRCTQNANCTCVKYERYYQSECVLMANCQVPTFCSRSNRYDMYVAPTTTTTTTWSTSSTMTSCVGSSFQSPWTGTEGGLTTAGGNTMRLHKAYCPKPNGIDVSVEQAVPSGTDSIGLSFGVVQIGGDNCPQCHGGNHWSSPLWVTLVNSKDTSKFFRWCFNRRNWGACDETEEVPVGQWHTREFSVSKFEQKFGHTDMTLRLGVYADQRTGTTLVRDVTYKKSRRV